MKKYSVKIRKIIVSNTKVIQAFSKEEAERIAWDMEACGELDCDTFIDEEVIVEDV